MENDLEAINESKNNKGKSKPEVKKILVRTSPAEHAALKGKAKAANLSLNDYLIESGLSVEYAPDPRERELRERAIFEIRKVSYNLGRMAKRLNQGNFSVEKVDAAMEEVMQAGRLIVEAYEAQTDKRNEDK